MIGKRVCGILLAVSAQLFLPELKIRPLLRLRDVEDVLRQRRVFHEVPARSTLIEWCENGTFESRRINGIIYVYEDSFVNWLIDIQTASAA